MVTSGPIASRVHPAGAGRVINLNATERGMGLYRSAGFDAPRHPALQLIVRRRAPHGDDRPPTIDSVGGRASGVV
jgi:hypothetical protein